MLQVGHTSQILLIDELLREIIRIIEAHPYRRWSTLAALARVCKGTSTPALDALWKSQYSAVPAFRSADKGFYYDEDYSCITWPNGHETWTWYHTLYSRKEFDETAVWNAVLKYSSRVKVLDPSLCNIHEVCFTPDAIQKIRNSNQMFFPNLEILHWPLDNLGDNAKDIEPFLSPNIKEIHIRRDSKRKNNIFPFVHKHNLQNLENISIHGELWGMLDNTHIQLEIVKNSPRLHTYHDFNECSTKLWLGLAASSFLRVLYARLGVPRREEPLLAPENPFPSLEKLTVVGSIPSILRHMKLLSFPRVYQVVCETLNSEEDGDPPQYLVEDLISTLSNRISKDRIQTIAIKSNTYERNNDNYPVISSRVFDSLKTDFSNLRRFYMNTDWRVYLDDNLLMELSNAWPNATAIDFTPRHLSRVTYPEDDIKITINGLIPVFQSCPKLQILGVVLHAEIDTMPEEEDMVQLPAFNLQTLKLGPSIIHKRTIKPVAKFFHNYMPKLSKMEAWMGRPRVRHRGDYYGLPYRERWEEVTNEIADLRGEAGMKNKYVDFAYPS
ncbi:hypothetical protein C8Q75DRAFT_867299 [Abortiporus biennis]|nr:hypothetical protein C8Q75DRAFT_867299 [Abortiporus biennis]